MYYIICIFPSTVTLYFFQGFFKSMKILKENFGNIYYTFDDPISAKDFFGNKLDRSSHVMAPLHLQELTQSEKSLLPPLAHEIIYRQQRCTVVTVFNLMAVAFNHNLSHGQNLNIENLIKCVDWLKNLIQSFGGLVQSENIEKSIEDAFTVHSNLIRLSPGGQIELVANNVEQGVINSKVFKGHPLSDRTMTISVPFVMLQIYVNPVLQYFIDGAILVTILSKRDKLTKGKIGFYYRTIQNGT